MGTSVFSPEHIRMRLLFWLRIMEEHAIFLRNGFPCERQDLIVTACGFEERMASLRREAENYGRMHEQERIAFLAAVRSSVQDFLAFKQLVLRLLINCSLGGSNYPLLVDHIAREAQEFLYEIARVSVVSPAALSLYTEVLREENFWIRIMADHAKFILHLLDPSERALLEKAEVFSDVFDQLLREAQDLESMLQASPNTFPTVSRFTSEVAERTRQFRDFKKTALQLISGCQALGLIPPRLAEHILEEAEHFLMRLKEIQSEIS